MLMNVRRTLFLEKLQVVVTTVAALGLIYWVIQSWFVPSDPLSPIVFLPAGSFGKLLLLGVVLWGLAIVAGLTTTLSRPEGAVAAALISLGGLSLRSHSMRPLLWSNGGSMSGIFIQMIIEVLLMGAMLGVAVVIIVCLRRLVARKFPRLMWCDGIGNLSGEQMQMLKAVNSKFNSSWFLKDPVMGYLVKHIKRENRKSGDTQGQKTDKSTRIRQREQLLRAGGCLVAGIAIGLLLLSLLLRSTARGQVVFALFASFMLSQVIAQQLYPTRSLLIACVTPLIAAIPVYMLGAYAGSNPGGDFWVILAPQFQALPIDWLTTATSGSVLGLWTSDRMREIRIFEILFGDGEHSATENGTAHT